MDGGFSNEKRCLICEKLQGCLLEDHKDQVYGIKTHSFSLCRLLSCFNIISIVEFVKNNNVCNF